MSKQTRRDFFVRTSCAALGMAGMSAGLRRLGLMTAFAEETVVSNYKALVCIFLSGGNDGNNVIVPLDATGYAAYSAVRGSSPSRRPRSASPSDSIRT